MRIRQYSWSISMYDSVRCYVLTEDNQWLSAFDIDDCVGMSDTEIEELCLEILEEQGYVFVQ